MNTPPNLGRLQRVDLRDIWTSEDRDFTPWLAREENLTVLGDAIGLDLELEAEEKSVGPFRADILCKDTLDDSWVLIENQLERTDHTHLGQLMTYASGLQTVTIVWVAAKFTEEHRAALDWLNEITNSTFKFFGLEVELWKIGDSLAAPKFNIISKPNEWSRSASRAARQIESEALSDTQLLQKEFWTAFNEYVLEKKYNLTQPKVVPKHWQSYAVGRSQFWIDAYCSVRDEWIGVSLNMGGENAKPHFHLLAQDKAAIEEGIDDTLEWHELPDKIQSRIYLTKKCDVKLKEDWPDYFAWLADRLTRYTQTFRGRVKALDAEDWVSNEPLDKEDADQISGEVE